MFCIDINITIFLNKENSFYANVQINNKKQKGRKQFYNYLHSRKGLPSKLEKLKDNPRKVLDAHKLKGKLEGKWSCSLGADIRMVYEIDDENKEIVVFTVGSHKEAYS